MRTLLALASLTLLVGAGIGCGDDTTSGAADMTMFADLHAPAGDMAKLNCGQLITCVQGCGTSTTCIGTCVAAASSSATTKAQTLAACINGVCGTADGGTGDCANPASPNCATCEMTAVGGTCHAAYATCQSDM